MCMMRTPARSVCSVMVEMRQFHMDYQVLWRKKDDTAPLSEREGRPSPLPGQAFIGFNLHGNTGHISKAHQSLSGRNDQTIENTQRTVRAYLESGSDS